MGGLVEMDGLAGSVSQHLFSVSVVVVVGEGMYGCVWW